MKCKNCKHEHQGTNPCNVVVDYDPAGADAISRVGVKPRACGCAEFVEPEDLPVCGNCGEILRFSQSAQQLIENYPYLFCLVWCVHCKHIVTAQITVMLPPIPKNAAAAGAHQGLHTPTGGPLG